MKRWQAVLLVLILALAAVLRFSGLDWDNYNHYHPDERYIAWVATTIEFPANIADMFDLTKSGLNPFYWPEDAVSEGIEVPQGTQRSFAYGHVPLYIGVAATRLVERIPTIFREMLPDRWLFTRDLLNDAQAVEFRHLTAVARAATALFDVGTVALVFLLGRRLYGNNVGLLAAAFLAVNVMHIQLARFFAVDPLLTFFVVAAVLAMVFSLRKVGETAEALPVRKRAAYLAIAAICTGLAIGSKFSAALLFLPLTATLLLVTTSGNRRFLLYLTALVLVAGITFLLTNPFAVLDWSCPAETPASRIGPLTLPAIDWRSCYLENIAKQGSMVRGSLDAPFARQYTDTLPYLFYIEQQVKWGMGPPLGILSFTGFAWAVWRAGAALGDGWRQRRQASFGSGFTETQQGELIILVWVVPYFVTTGFFFVKFMRYMQPLTPFLMIFAAAMLLRLRFVWLRRALVASALVVSLLYALSMVSMYQQEHPWVAASKWIYRNVATGATILSEQWDEGLPSSLEVDGLYRRRFEYGADELTWLTGADSLDSQQKLAENLARLADADYVTLSSNRIYGVVPRLAERYPLTSQYHQLLFDGNLGYELVFVAGRFPKLGGFYLKPDTFAWPGLEPPSGAVDYLASLPGSSGGRVDESFVVYDQPFTMIFANIGRLSNEEMFQQFEIP